MKQQPVPYRRMVFVCTNVREEDGRPACGLRGSEKICEALKEEVKKRGLKGKVRALKSGCMDLCETGPNVMIFPDGVLHSGVTAEDVPALIEKYLI
jgi:NADH:ubiquinone oxidoreductase subunit E